MPTAIPLIIAGVGTGINAYQQHKAAKSANRRSSRMMDTAEAQIQSGPGFLEEILRSQFNPGQDAGLQALRSTPGGNFIQQFLGDGGGEQLINSLQPVRDRQLRGGLAEIRASSPGLGQRFGSANMANERNLVGDHLQTIAAQDAATRFEAQGRQLQFGTNILELLAGQENNRLGRNITATTGMSAIPSPVAGQLGQPLIDVGSLLLLNQLRNQGQTPAGNFVPSQRPGLNVNPNVFGY